MVIVMMHEFLSANRSELIARCRIKEGRRTALLVDGQELEFGVPIFLDQIIKTLRVEETAQPMLSRRVSGPSGGGKPALSEIGESAARHGSELLRHGFTVDQVVHDYGDLCQAITDLAFETNASIEVSEFRTLNRCLDNAIADAVTEFNYQREFAVADKQLHALNERLGFFAHELRNLINTATLALHAVKAGNVGLGGATGGILERSLVGLRNLVDRSLTEVRMTAGMPPQYRLFSLADFVAEITLTASLEAKFQECRLTVAAVDPELAVDADRDLLLAAAGNLLQNAFKFTQLGSEVTLNAYASGGRIVIDVEDHCGGLPDGDEQRIFVPFSQSGTDRTGLGLGLSISRRSVEENGGKLRVRDVPGSGCVFSIDIPRHSLAELAPVQ